MKPKAQQASAYENLSRDTVLTRDEVAEWIKVKPRQVRRLGIPQLVLGPKTPRYFVGDVRDFLESCRKHNNALGAERRLHE
jgi:hypothetical protein